MSQFKRNHLKKKKNKLFIKRFAFCYKIHAHLITSLFIINILLDGPTNGKNMFVI